MPGEGGVELEVRDDIAMDEDEIACDEAALIQVAQEVTNRVGVRDTDKVERREGRDDAVGIPPGGLMDVVFDVFRVSPAVYEDVLDAVRGEELERVLDDRDVD